MTPTYKRVLLKISGEALMGNEKFGISSDVLARVANDIADTAKLGVQVAVVVGGGNIWRGASRSADNMDRASADYVGMLATVMNAVSLQSAIEKCGVTTRVQTAIPIGFLIGQGLCAWMAVSRISAAARSVTSRRAAW